MTRNIAVVAIGGNSLVKDRHHITWRDQYENVKQTCTHIACLAEKNYEIIITHGNGPQVGFLLLRSYIARKLLPEIEISTGNALTQAEIGYMIQQALKNLFKEHNIKKDVMTIVTQVVVGENDPAFQHPTKPVGPFYTRREALELQKEVGWTMREDAGRGFRRVVPSPEPKSIVELEGIKDLVGSGKAVIAVGGGGIPVVKQGKHLKGVDAVIDKDLASSLLAVSIQARLLLISTSVPQVYSNYNLPEQKGLNTLTIKDAENFMAAGHFARGSMAEKIEASIRFLKRGGEEVIITNPENITQALAGKAGTKITAA